MRNQLLRHVTAGASVLALLAACGGGESTSPETFFEDLEAAVMDFASDLDEIDADYVDRSWDVPDDAVERSTFIWKTDLEIQSEYLDAWRDYVDRLEELQPPEGYPEAGEDYAEGLPEYFEEAIIDNEQGALAATEFRRELWSDVSDPGKAMMGGRELPEAERRLFDDASDALFDAEDTLEDEWEWFEDSAEAVGHPIEDAVDVRTDFDMAFLPFRAASVAIDISRAADQG